MQSAETPRKQQMGNSVLYDVIKRYLPDEDEMVMSNQLMTVAYNISTEQREQEADWSTHSARYIYWN